MSVKDKLGKLRKGSFWKPTSEEKTGVMNGLILLGAAVGTALALKSHDANAQEAESPVCTGDDWHNWSDWQNSWDNWANWNNWGNWNNWEHWGNWGNSSD